MMQMNITIPDQQPRGVFEHFILGNVEITRQYTPITECKLDEKGTIRYNYYKNLYQIETVLGIAKLNWKSQIDREQCIKLQKTKNKNRLSGENRWTEIISMSNAITKGEILPYPALVHPKLHKNNGLLIIDGARRIIANIEASSVFFYVVIITPK